MTLENTLTPLQVVEKFPFFSLHTLAHWRYRNEGPPWYKLCGKVLYLENDVATWVEAQRHEPTEKAGRGKR